ncbi:metal-binding protein [Olivibacter sp. SDN3]|uniref:Ada metal-binding domain-containing protein n=1 Tax=Olivibacter sp. SDN3 TaxID=2764720 RepID=UPI0016518464|nr:Ada metal-binding domain-containing protein [Olivibacter sp. SDN3]QNL51041.1 metal-binding protein [Olivibacter sp. SDN3]
MIYHLEISDRDLRSKIRRQTILMGGNRKLKIYGQLSCSSGKKIKKANRVFFTNEEEALKQDYRPCGHCKRVAYKQWKKQKINR